MSRLQVKIIPVTPIQQNCALLVVEDSRRAVVVDAGGDVARILAAVDEAKAEVGAIWLTHGHLDHVGGAAELKAALAARGVAVPIVGPDARDGFLMAAVEEQGLAFGIPGLRNVVPDRWVVEGDRLELGDFRFDVLHCPGHTPGHVVLVEKAVRFAVVGDVLFRGSVGRTDFPYGDGPALIRGIKEKLLPLGDDIAFICGHGPGSTLGAERRENPFLV